MTRDQLELTLRREGLTRPQVEAAMCAADAYALAQCRAAVEWWTPGEMHWQVHKPWSGPACSPASGKPCTTERGRVRCGACKQTDAWKQAA